MAARLAADLQALRYAEDVRRLYQQLRRSICQSLLGLANALEAKDPYTRGHSERVGALSRELAAALGLPAADVECVTHAGLLHDIGKIGVPESLLRKRGTLTGEEWAVMRQHPVIGARIVAPFEFFAGGAMVIRHHHERWDGSGYPDGLAGGAIPLGARVVAVADVLDALTSDRPYRAA
ncbi:MAG TPA: HD domain-containing phosphohydrolase, partial [Methylomirabilota bacterium]|nr:HD domain-containing phosphohydrolase [Methylomirabilota bacterium]